MWKASDFLRSHLFGEMSLELGRGIGQDDADMLLDDAVLPVYIVTMFYLFFWIYPSYSFWGEGRVQYCTVSLVLCVWDIYGYSWSFWVESAKCLFFCSCIFKNYEERVLNEEGVEELQSLSQNHPHPGKFHMHTNMTTWKMHFLFKYGYSEYLC